MAGQTEARIRMEVDGEVALVHWSGELVVWLDKLKLVLGWK